MKSLKHVLLFLLIMPLLVGPIREVKSSSLYGWTPVSNPVENDAGALTSVFMIDSSDGWAVGWLGTILHWDGNSWEAVPSPTVCDLFSVFMLSSNDGWAVGAGPINNTAILHWDGISWNPVPPPEGMNAILRSVYMIGSNDVWAVGCISRNGFDYEVMIRWNGTEWSLMSSTYPSQLNSVFMIDSSDGWAVGERIVHWDGTSWTAVSSPTGLLIGIFMLSASDGWAVGAAGKTLHWDGEVWSLMTSPSSYTLQSIFMTNPSNGWFVGEDIIYRDGSELELVSDPLPSGYYRSGFMLSTTEGWAVGSEWVQVGPGAEEQRPRILHYGSIVPEATIDVELYAYPDNIRLRDKNLQVAILGSPTFDVKEISPETINMGGVSVARRGPTKAPELSISYRDVNSDSHMDLVSSFSIPELVLGGVLSETTTSLTLTATLLDGTPIEGTDTVNVVRK